jgi:hypothetical protein
MRRKEQRSEYRPWLECNGLFVNLDEVLGLPGLVLTCHTQGSVLVAGVGRKQFPVLWLQIALRIRVIRLTFSGMFAQQLSTTWELLHVPEARISTRDEGVKPEDSSSRSDSK